MILNFTLEKVHAEKKKNPTSDIKAKNSLKIIEVKEQALSPLDNQKVLKFNFLFAISYDPDIAYIEFQGHVVYMTDEKLQKEILANWTKNKQINQELSAPIMNLILTRCNVKALSLSQELNIPPHIQFPKLALKSEIESMKKAS